jgi:hypothetical protein
MDGSTELSSTLRVAIASTSCTSGSGAVALSQIQNYCHYLPPSGGQLCRLRLGHAADRDNQGNMRLALLRPKICIFQYD